MATHGEQLDRRSFVTQSAGLVAGFGWLGSAGSLEGLRAALAAAMPSQKPVLTQESFNAFLAEAGAADRGEAIAREAAADPRAFLEKHFTVEGNCERLVSTLSREDTAKITEAMQEGFAAHSEVKVDVASLDLRTVSDPKVDVQRVNTVGDDAQLTTIRLFCGQCER